jgi:hypothetical protein
MYGVLALVSSLEITDFWDFVQRPVLQRTQCVNRIWFLLQVKLWRASTLWDQL